ncbi:MAG TPA: ATP-binding cassette domain-containing protein [Candidatus Saccharimonadales bacterium]|nr:ATP-binding cassette domain-containing protein [Candidatus Saccharimonadales bacterium]
MIKADHVTKKFGDFTAVDDVSFEVGPGELFALLGPNGAGKSTTIKMLTTLLRPTNGTLSLNNHNVVHKQDAARKSFGIVFQDPSVDSDLTAYENMEIHAVLYGVAATELPARIEELLKLVELWERRDDLVRTFSGGMKRRLEIARGLLHHPKILFLDEPTLGLDAQTRNLLWDYVQHLSREKHMTVLFTTHYLEEAEANATRIAFIDHGKIIAIGTAKELMKDTKTKTLEQAYLKLTGTGTRDQNANAHDVWRERHRARAMR